MFDADRSIDQYQCSLSTMTEEQEGGVKVIVNTISACIGTNKRRRRKKEAGVYTYMLFFLCT
jgi:hypothetical protein